MQGEIQSNRALKERLIAKVGKPFAFGQLGATTELGHVGGSELLIAM
jgi:hypothetical protein